MKTIILRQRHVVEIDGHRVMKEAGDTAELPDKVAEGFVDSGWAAWPSDAKPPEVRAEDPTPQNRDEEVAAPPKKLRGRPRKTTATES